MEELANYLIAQEITGEDVVNKINESMGLGKCDCKLLDNYTLQELQCVLWWIYNNSSDSCIN